MAVGEGGDVVGLDGGEHRDAQLVAAELAVGLGVDDAVGAQRRRRSRRRRPCRRSRWCRSSWLRSDGLATNGCANVLASAQP